MGIKLARNLMKANFTDWIALSQDYSIAESRVPKKWLGKSLKELDIRKAIWSERGRAQGEQPGGG